MPTDGAVAREPLYDPFDSEHFTDPHARLASARARCPISEPHPGLTFVARDADVRAILRDPAHFSNIGNFEIEDDPSPDPPTITQLDPPRHGKFRRLLLAALSPAAVQAAEPFIRETAAQLIENLADKDHGDLVAGLAGPLPARVIAHIIGAPEADAPAFYGWTREITAHLPFHKTLPAWRDFNDYVRALIAHRRSRADPPDDFVTRLMTTEVEGTTLSDDEVRISVFQIIAAGSDPTSHLIANCIYELLRVPQRWARVRDDRALLPRAIEESLRHDTPLQFVLRTSTQTTELGSTKIETGNRVVLGLASANRDETVWEDADEFSLERREPIQHIAFGDGIHICLGATLAHLEASIAIGLLMDRFPGFRLAPGFVYVKVDGPFNRGPKRLDVIWGAP